MCPSIVPTIVSQTGVVVLVVAVVAAAAVVGRRRRLRRHWPRPGLQEPSLPRLSAELRVRAASSQAVFRADPPLWKRLRMLCAPESAKGCGRDAPRVRSASKTSPPNNFSYFFFLQDFLNFLNFVDVSRCSWFSAVFAVTIRFPLKSSFRGKRLHPKRIDSDAKSRRFSIFH